MQQPPITIRHATPDDVPTVAKIHMHSWQWAYQNLIPADYLASLSTTLDKRIANQRQALEHLPHHNRWWVAEQDGIIAGFTITGPSHDTDASPTTAEVFLIYLLPDAAGKGIGRLLFTHAIEDLRQRNFEQATLWVLESNTRARAFYEKAGWLPDGAHKNEELSNIILHELRYHIILQ